MNREILDLLKKNNGNLSLKDARAAGILPMTLDRLVDKGELEKEAPGFYVSVDSLVDELYLAQSIYSKGVFSHETVLDLFQIGTYIPKKINMTFPKGYHVPKSRLDQWSISPHYTNKTTFEVGIISGKSFNGNKIRMYDLERTLCDMWNPRYKASVEIKQEALKEYMQLPSRELNKLRKYIKILKPSAEMISYMQPLY